MRLNASIAPAGPLVLLALTAAPLLLHADAAAAQVRASERATVTQTVDGTVITVEYSRPVARGRVHLFGGEVHWGEVWTPGANDATVLEVSAPVVLGSDTVPAGRWSVWMVVAEDGPWELVLDPRDTLFHTQRPEPTPEQIRMPVATAVGEHVEVLTWSFPDVKGDATTLELAWGTLRVPLRLGVTPSYTLVIPAADAAPYTGEWELVMQPPPADPSAGPGGDDGTAAPATLPPAPFTVRHDPATEALLVRTLFYSDEGPSEADMIMLPRAEGVFGIGFADEAGGLFDTLDGVYLEFALAGDGTSAAFTIRGPDDQVFGRGTRIR